MVCFLLVMDTSICWLWIPVVVCYGCRLLLVMEVAISYGYQFLLVNCMLCC